MKKKNKLFDKFFLNANIFILIIFFIIPPADLKKKDESKNNGDYIVLLHGLGRTSNSMKKMELFFRKKGYQVINKNYPSTKYNIEILSDVYLDEIIKKNCKDDSKKINFVTHSLGGIVLRYYLKNHKIANLGKVVMLSAPNGGSEISDFLSGFCGIFDFFLGPSLKQLGTGENSIPRKLGRVDFETGIITGNKSFEPINSFIIPGDDDGKVSVERAKIEGMKDFKIVNRTHTFIMNAPEVMEAIENFIVQGKF